MDPKHAGGMLKHLEKQHELLVDGRQSMLDELHQYQIEEEMLMRKLHEVMSAHSKLKEDGQSASNAECRDNRALVCTNRNGEIADSSASEVATNSGSKGEDVKIPITYSRRKKQ
ncbi:hypothetical protein QQ045_024491 [Rhodiola kirilowii]